MADVNHPMSASALVDYQAGSIVSKSLLKNSSGSVTLFAFDKEEKLTEHTTPFDALLLVVDGEMSITIADAEYLLSSGELLFLPANLPHSVKAETKSKMMLIMIREQGPIQG